MFTLVDGPIPGRLDLPILERWSILALRFVAVASFASLMFVLIGRWGMIPTSVFFVILGNGASGGAVAPPLLPAPAACPGAPARHKRPTAPIIRAIGVGRPRA